MCVIDGCWAPVHCRRLCDKHYRRLLVTGTPVGLKLVRHDPGQTCSAPGCMRACRKQGMCNSHYTAAWRARNPEAAAKAKRTSWERRRARKAGAAGSHTAEEWSDRLAEFHRRCAYCLAAATEKDHVVALNAGGSDSIDNIVPACTACNRDKSDKGLLLWMMRRRAA